MIILSLIIIALIEQFWLFWFLYTLSNLTLHNLLKYFPFVVLGRDESVQAKDEGEEYNNTSNLVSSMDDTFTTRLEFLKAARRIIRASDWDCGGV